MERRHPSSFTVYVNANRPNDSSIFNVMHDAAVVGFTQTLNNESSSITSLSAQNVKMRKAGNTNTKAASEVINLFYRCYEFASSVI